MNITLPRDLDDAQCSLGTVKLYDVTFQSLERPWIGGPTGGVPGRSCVPPGTYQLVPHDTEAHPKSFALVNEALGVYHYNIPIDSDGRTACLIHVANYASELRGCIALGMSRERYGASWMIQQSKIAIEKFYALVPWVDGHTLTILEAP